MSVGLGLIFAVTAGVGLAQSVRGGCGTGANSGICVGEMRVPKDKVQLFEAASTQAIDALASPGFRADLARFIAGLSPADAHAAAWTLRNADALADGLLRGVSGVRLKTYGGPFAYISAKGPSRNVAKEGRPGGPIRLNRYAIGTAAEIANSIAHEAAHRAPLLLTHPSYDRDIKIGYCEPPYVIGQLVQKQIEGAAWSPDETVCNRLH